VTPQEDARLDLLRRWLGTLDPALGLRVDTLQPASADASFRRYFRVAADAPAHVAGPAASFVAMDAPPDREDTRPFVHVAGLLRAAGLNAPAIVAQDAQSGFLLLTDLGRDTYLDAFRRGAADAGAMFADAIAALVRWQLASRPGVLPPYDEALLRRELSLFPDWYVARHLGHTLTQRQSDTLQAMFARIVAANLAQPSVYVHRDYMPRNLMVSTPRPGILDFQDAVYGPISYDIAALMRDAFLSWDEEQVIDWTVRYWQQARAQGLPVAADFGAFYRDFEWMGLQRHLKVLGIFARINYRDGKPHYLADTPRFVGYVRGVTRRYDELLPLARLFDELEGVAERIGYTF
jgi:hypothetical protein